MVTGKGKQEHVRPRMLKEAVLLREMIVRGFVTCQTPFRALTNTLCYDWDRFLDNGLVPAYIVHQRRVLGKAKTKLTVDLRRR